MDFNNLTQQAEDKFSTYDFESDDTVPGKEYIETLNCVTNFYDYTWKFAKEKGYDQDRNEKEALIKYITQKCAAHKDMNGKPLVSAATIKNWLENAFSEDNDWTGPAGNQAGRENVYRLCFALGLNAEETRNFFLKAYLERPFNYKNIHEAVYFFCLNKGLTYNDAERIIAKIEAIPFYENADAQDVTEAIGEELQKKNTEDEVIRYIVENRSGFKVQNQTATKHILELIEECKKLAEQELSGSCEDTTTEKISITNVDSLLNAIYGYSARSVQVDKKDHTTNGTAKATYVKKYDKSISKSNFPKLIKENFPQRQQIENILVGKASFDVIRKTLIMLNFYHFFAEATLNQEEEYSKYWFDEFVDETNILLADCGYVRLYWRNPYDWMFGYCAYSLDVGGNPLEQLRLLIEEFYLKFCNPDGKYYDETIFTA